MTPDQFDGLSAGSRFFLSVDGTCRVYEICEPDEYCRRGPGKVFAKAVKRTSGYPYSRCVVETFRREDSCKMLIDPSSL